MPIQGLEQPRERQGRVLPPARAGARKRRGAYTNPASQNSPHPIDNNSLIRMCQAGLGEDILLQTIMQQPGHYDTNPEALIALKQAGLSDAVISSVQAHGTGLSVRSRTPSAKVREPPALPPPGVEGIGVYYKNKAGAGRRWIRSWCM